MGGIADSFRSPDIGEGFLLSDDEVDMSQEGPSTSASGRRGPGRPRLVRQPSSVSSSASSAASKECFTQSTPKKSSPVSMKKAILTHLTTSTASNRSKVKRRAVKSHSGQVITGEEALKELEEEEARKTAKEQAKREAKAAREEAKAAREAGKVTRKRGTKGAQKEG